eukprot:4326965-Amphidinium_carterae.1
MFSGDLAAIRKQLASLETNLGGKPAGTQQPNKGGGKGTRRGRPVCFKCKEVKDPKKEGPGVPAPKAKASASLEGDLKKHIAAAKDSPALQTQLQTALHAVQQQKQETLPIQDRRAHLLAQARTLADKMDQQAKMAQEATTKREQFKEELVTVYLALERLPAEPLP